MPSIRSLFTALTPTAASFASFENAAMTNSIKAVAASSAPLIVCRIALGMGEGVAFPAVHSLLGRYVPEEQQTSAVAIITAASYLGIAVAFGYVGVQRPYSPWPCVNKACVNVCTPLESRLPKF